MAGLLPSDRPEDGQARVAVLLRNRLEDQGSSLQKCVGVHSVEVGCELELLTDRWLGDAERFGDLTLADPVPCQNVCVQPAIAANGGAGRLR